MENTTVIIGLITAIISLVAAIIPLIVLVSTKNNKEVPTINVRGKNNTIAQDNSTHKNITYVEKKQVIYVSSGNRSTSNDDGMAMLLGIVMLLLVLYTNRVVLLRFMYIPLAVSALFSVLICIFSVKGFSLTPIHPNRVVNIFFTLIPVAISVIFVAQNTLFLYDINSIESVQKLQIGATILFDYVGISFLLFTQVCVLVVAQVKFPKVKKFMMNLSRMWPAAVILPTVPIVLWFLQK